MSSTVIIAPEIESRVVQAVALSTIIHADEPKTEVIEAIGSGSLTANYFRGLINYDGGHAGTDYGDLIHLDGGGAADGRRYPI